MRNFHDSKGYGSTVREELIGFIAGLLIVAAIILPVVLK